MPDELTKTFKIYSAHTVQMQAYVIESLKTLDMITSPLWL